MDPNPAQRRWNAINFAYRGAWLGSLLVVAHETYEALADTFPRDVNPFLHVITEFALYALGGALVFWAIATIHNGIIQAKRLQSVQRTQSLILMEHQKAWPHTE